MTPASEAADRDGDRAACRDGLDFAKLLPAVDRFRRREDPLIDETSAWRLRGAASYGGRWVVLPTQASHSVFASGKDDGTSLRRSACEVGHHPTDRSFGRTSVRLAASDTRAALIEKIALPSAATTRPGVAFARVEGRAASGEA